MKRFTWPRSAERNLLGLDDLIGNFLPGKEADFVVMEPTATPLQQLRYDNSVSLVDKLFVMMTLGDDRSITAPTLMVVWCTNATNNKTLTSS